LRLGEGGANTPEAGIDGLSVEFQKLMLEAMERMGNMRVFGPDGPRRDSGRSRSACATSRPGLLPRWFAVSHRTIPRRSAALPKIGIIGKS